MKHEPLDQEPKGPRQIMDAMFWTYIITSICVMAIIGALTLPAVALILSGKAEFIIK